MTGWENNARVPIYDPRDEEDEDDAPLSDSSALFMARRLIGFILADTYPALGIECLSLVTGIGYEGSSMSDIAKRYHCTRADVSKRCVDLCDAFGIPPVRAMRQEKTRECSKDARIRKIIELCEL